MANLKNLTGQYTVSGKLLIHNFEGTKLLITSRINATSKKAVSFLLDKTDGNGGYISSLYSDYNTTGVDKYNFDFKGVKYCLTVNSADNAATIVKRG